MVPEYSDRDIVYVQKSGLIETGDIGISQKWIVSASRKLGKIG